jgi:hypothetical protein
MEFTYAAALNGSCLPKPFHLVGSLFHSWVPCNSFCFLQSFNILHFRYVLPLSSRPESILSVVYFVYLSPSSSYICLCILVPFPLLLLLLAFSAFQYIIVSKSNDCNRIDVPKLHSSSLKFCRRRNSDDMLRVQQRLFLCSVYSEPGGLVGRLKMIRRQPHTGRGVPALL